MLSQFGRGDTLVRGSFIISITDTFDKIAKFISTCNATYGMCEYYKYGSNFIKKNKVIHDMICAIKVYIHFSVEKCKDIFSLEEQIH